MKVIYIAVGSLRRPKLNAVWEAVTVFGPQIDPDARFEVVGREVESGVSHTPLSREEMMRGARQRAEALARLPQDTNEPWEFFVGLEGGLDVVGQTPVVSAAEPSTSVPQDARSASPNAVQSVAPPLANPAHPSTPSRLVFLQNWAYVCNRTGRNFYGQSGAITIPEPLAARVIDHGIELAAAIDEYAGGRGIRDAQGAWGVFTGNKITRQDAFRTAVLNAFAPFYNPAMYL